VLASAKENRPELEKVISHYEELGDTTKLNAAYFLIEYVPGNALYWLVEKDFN